MGRMAGAALVACAATAAHAAEPDPLFTDPQDGWFDVSDFLGKTYGFVPVIAPVTEPAVGYGATGALLLGSRCTSSSAARGRGCNGAAQRTAVSA
jgi:hypothetical protein